MATFHIDQAFGQVGDVLKSYAWELELPDLNKVVKSLTSESFKIRCRSTAMPGRSIQPIQSNFLGMQQVFAGKVAFSHTWNVTLEEFEDQAVAKAMYEWNQLLFDVDPKNATGGGSQVAFKRQGLGAGYAIDIFITQLKHDNTPLDRRIQLVNCWPQSVDDIGLDYAGNDSVKQNVTFAYDYWKQI